MLVLTFKPDDHADLTGLYVKDDQGNMVPAGAIKINLVEIRGRQVRIGFTAPKAVQIHRVKSNKNGS